MDSKLTRFRYAEITNNRTVSCVCEQTGINSPMLSCERCHFQTVNQNYCTNTQTTTTRTANCKMKKQFYHTNNKLISSVYSLLLFLMCSSIVHSNSTILNMTIEDQVAQVGRFFHYNILSNDSILVTNFKIKVHTILCYMNMYIHNVTS